MSLVNEYPGTILLFEDYTVRACSSNAVTYSAGSYLTGRVVERDNVTVNFKIRDPLFPDDQDCWWRIGRPGKRTLNDHTQRWRLLSPLEELALQAGD